MMMRHDGLPILLVVRRIGAGNAPGGDTIEPMWQGSCTASASARKCTLHCGGGSERGGGWPSVAVGASRIHHTDQQRPSTVRHMWACVMT